MQTPFKPRKLLRINARPRIQEAEAAGSGAADSKLIQHDAGRAQWSSIALRRSTSNLSHCEAVNSQLGDRHPSLRSAYHVRVGNSLAACRVG